MCLVYCRILTLFPVHKILVEKGEEAEGGELFTISKGHTVSTWSLNRVFVDEAVSMTVVNADSIDSKFLWLSFTQC